MSCQCPRCSAERKIYIRKHAFVSFACACGYVETAPDIPTLRGKIQEARKIESAKSSTPRREYDD